MINKQIICSRGQIDRLPFTKSCLHFTNECVLRTHITTSLIRPYKPWHAIRGLINYQLSSEKAQTPFYIRNPFKPVNWLVQVFKFMFLNVAKYQVIFILHNWFSWFRHPSKFHQQQTKMFVSIIMEKSIVGNVLFIMMSIVCYIPLDFFQRIWKFGRWHARLPCPYNPIEPRWRRTKCACHINEKIAVLQGSGKERFALLWDVYFANSYDVNGSIKRTSKSLMAK